MPDEPSGSTGLPVGRTAGSSRPVEMTDFFVDSLAVSFGWEPFCLPCELLWGLNSRFPREPVGRREEAARRGLRRVIDGGYVLVHECREWPPSEAPVSRERSLELLESERFWAHPAAWSGPPYYWFAATEKGEEALESGALASL